MKMGQIVFQNVGIQNSDTGELPTKKHTTFRTWQKFEMKNFGFLFFFLLNMMMTVTNLYLCCFVYELQTIHNETHINSHC